MAVLKKFAGGVVEVVEVKSNESQLGSVMGTGEGVGTSNFLPPVSSQTRRFVDVTMERQQRLAIFDEALNGDAPDIEIERRMIDGPSIERSPVEVSPIRRRVEEAHCSFEIAIFGQSNEIGGYGPKANFVGIDRQRPLPPFR